MALLRIGAHLLEGKIVKLKKPLAILKKVPISGVAGESRSPVEYKTLSMVGELILPARESPELLFRSAAN